MAQSPQWHHTTCGHHYIDCSPTMDSQWLKEKQCELPAYHAHCIFPVYMRRQRLSLNEALTMSGEVAVREPACIGNGRGHAAFSLAIKGRIQIFEFQSWFMPDTFPVTTIDLGI